MLEKLKAAAARLARSLKIAEASRLLARRRHSRQHGRAVKNWDRYVKASERADELRAAGKLKKAAAKDARAHRSLEASKKAATRAQELMAQIKRLTQKIEKIETDLAVVESKLEELKRTHGIAVVGNHVRGGNRQQRMRVAQDTAYAACRTGRRSNFYDQAGRWDVDHPFTGVSRSCRSDCSQEITSWFKACDLEDPNRTGYSWGYTGTMLQNGREISRAAARYRPDAIVLYGPRSSPFHCESPLGDGTETTTGHGSAPVDRGSFGMTGGEVHFYVYD